MKALIVTTALSFGACANVTVNGAPVSRFDQVLVATIGVAAVGAIIAQDEGDRDDIGIPENRCPTCTVNRED